MARKKPQGQVVRSTRRLTDGSMTIQLLGCYYFDEELGTSLIEVMVESPWYLLRDPQSFRLYTAPHWDEPPIPIRPQFFLDSSGERLIGSYLHPSAPEEWPRNPAEARRRVTFRFASFMPEPDGGRLLTSLGFLDEIEWEPIPERLLRLVWFEG